MPIKDNPLCNEAKDYRQKAVTVLSDAGRGLDIR